MSAVEQNEPKHEYSDLTDQLRRLHLPETTLNRFRELTGKEDLTAKDLPDVLDEQLAVRIGQVVIEDDIDAMSAVYEFVHEIKTVIENSGLSTAVVGSSVDTEREAAIDHEEALLIAASRFTSPLEGSNTRYLDLLGPKIVPALVQLLEREDLHYKGSQDSEKFHQGLILRYLAKQDVAVIEPYEADIKRFFDNTPDQDLKGEAAAVLLKLPTHSAEIAEKLVDRTIGIIEDQGTYDFNPSPLYARLPGCIRRSGSTTSRSGISDRGSGSEGKFRSP